MRFSGASKRRRDSAAAASGRVPPVWAARPSPGAAPVWPPRYGPLGSPFIVPFMAGAPPPPPPPPDVQLCAAAGVPGVFKREKANIVQFEWNGCTFYRYIPDKMNAAGAAGRLVPTPPPPPLPPFGRPPRPYEWHQRTQGRRRKQQMFPPRTPVPAWVPVPNLPPERSGVNKQYGGAAAPTGGSPSGGGPFQGRDNPRIPRKESKPPASHVHLPPFLAAASSKSGTTMKTPSPPAPVQGPPRGAPFRNKDAASAPLPYSVRAAFGSDGPSPPLPKRPEQRSAPSIPTSSANQAAGGGAKSKFGGAGAVAARRSQDSCIPDSDILGAKPKKRMANMTFNKSTAERPVSGPACNNGSKTFTRAPPFRNSSRVYSSTVLKDAGGKQESRGAAGESKPASSTPNISPPKEQRPSRHERRNRLKAELVGNHLILSQEEKSPNKKGDGDKGATAAPQKASTNTAQPPRGGKRGREKSSAAQKGRAATPRTKTPAWSDFDASGFQSQVATLVAGTGPANTGRSSADACTQVAENFAFNEQGDRYLTPGPRSSIRSGSKAVGELTSPSRDEWLNSKSRNVSIQTHENEQPSQPQVEKGGKSGCRASVQAQVGDTQSAYRKVDESKRDVIGCNGVAGPTFEKVEVNGVLDEALSDGEQNASLASYLDEPPTSSSEIYLDSLVSNGTSTSSPREDTYRKSICGANRKSNQDGSAMLFDEMNVFLKECSPIKTAAERAEAAAQAQALNCTGGASSSCPSSNAPSRSPGDESAQPQTSSSALTSTSCSSLSKGDGFSDISAPQSPLAKDLKVPDTSSLASDVIVINFAEDTTTLREHLEGLAADYNARKGEDNPAGAYGTDAEENDPKLLAINTSGPSNVLERHTGSSPTGSIAPVLQPTPVSPGDVSKLAQETRSAGGDFCGETSARGRGESSTQEQPRDQRRRRGGELSERGDDPFAALHKVAVGDTRGADCAGSYQRKEAFCSKCGDYCGSPGSGDSEGVVRVCSCKMRRTGFRSMAVAGEMEEALKEEYRDPQLVPYYVEETVEYLLMDSDSEEYEEAKRRASVHLGSHGEADIEERSAASEPYPETSASWKKLKEGSEASAISAARCSSEGTTAASRALMYDCPWWTYDQGSDGASDLKGSNKALASCDHISTSSGAAPEIGPSAAATLHPWSAPLGSSAPGTSHSGATAAEAVGNNPWGPFLATAHAMVGPRMEAASGDYKSSEQVACRMARSDADFSTLYMEGQLQKPSLKQRWASVDVGATAAGGEARPSGMTAAMGTDRDSLSFYEFPMNEQQEAMPPQRHSLSMETLFGSNRIDAASTSSKGGGGEPPLTEANVMPQSAEAIENKDSGAHSPSAQCCDLELYGPVNKGGPAVCTVVVPPQTMAEDGAKGDASFEGVVLTPPDDLNSCGDKKIPEGPKPMGKIRTKFRDFFWKHK